MRYPSENLLETFPFYHIFAGFQSGWGCNILNKNQPPSNLAKYQYFIGAKDFKNHFMNISSYIALVLLWLHSNKEKNQEDLKNGIMGAL